MGVNDAPRTRAYGLTPAEHFALMVLAVARDDGREVRVSQISSWPYSRDREYRDQFEPTIHRVAAARLRDRELAQVHQPLPGDADERPIAEVTRTGYVWATEEVPDGV